MFNWAASLGICSLGVVIWLSLEYPPPSSQAQQVSLQLPCQPLPCFMKPSALPTTIMSLLWIPVPQHDRTVMPANAAQVHLSIALQHLY